MRFIETSKYWLILLFLICFAFLVRLQSFVDAREVPKLQPLAFSTIGSGSDQDYQMKCGSHIARRLASEFMTHYDYLFMCPLMGVTFERFTFIDSLLIFSLTTILIGTAVALTPYLLFSSPKKVSLGGIIGSVILTFNPTMIEGSSGRFYIYPLVTIIFSFYLFTLFKALKYKTPLWTNTFATVAAIQSLNKPFLFVNDIPLILIFPFLLSVQDVHLQKKFPFFSLKFQHEHWIKGVVAILTYFSITISYEIFHTKVTDGFSFLTDLFIDTGGPSTKDAVLGASLNFDGGFKQKVENILALGVLAIHEVLKFFHYTFAIIFAFISIHFTKKQMIPWGLLTTLLVGVLAVTLHLTKGYFLVKNLHVAVPLLTKFDIFEISILSICIVCVAFSSIKGFTLVASHVFYFAALAMTLAAVYQPQLFVTLLIWLAVMVAYAISEGLERFSGRFTSRIQLLLLLCLAVFFIPSLYGSARSLKHSTLALQNEIRYLRWVDTVVPDTSYILGNGNEHLVLLGKFTHKTILTNALFVASKIKPANMVWENTEFSPSFPAFVKHTMEKNDPNVQLYILDQNITKWEEYLGSGASETYPKGKYALKEVARSDYLHRKIYVLSNP